MVNIKDYTPEFIKELRKKNEEEGKLCIVCGDIATHSNNTLCLNCWNDAEVFIEDTEDLESELAERDNLIDEMYFENTGDY